MRVFWVCTLLSCASAAFAADKYDGPRPPKKDILYLAHADNLIPTDALDATEDRKKDDVIASVPWHFVDGPYAAVGADFHHRDRQTSARGLELYKLDVKNGAGK
jgi:hypothetical protein